MAKINLDPYLFFQGNAREAMEFYKSIFGGELSVSPYSDLWDTMPEDEQKRADKNWIMHSLLDTGDFRIMASDSAGASAKAAKVELSLSSEDEQKLRGYWDALLAGGKVTMPLEKAPWGDTFGMLQDKYRIDWMVNITQSK